MYLSAIIVIMVRKPPQSNPSVISPWHLQGVVPGYRHAALGWREAGGGGPAPGCRLGSGLPHASHDFVISGHRFCFLLSWSKPRLHQAGWVLSPSPHWPRPVSGQDWRMLQINIYIYLDIFIKKTLQPFISLT